MYFSNLLYSYTWNIATAMDDISKYRILNHTLGSPWAAKRVRSVSTGWTATVAVQAASPPQTKCTKESRALYAVTLCTSFVKLSNAMNLQKQTYTGQGVNPYHWHGSPTPLSFHHELHPPLVTTFCLCPSKVLPNLQPVGACAQRIPCKNYWAAQGMLEIFWSLDTSAKSCI